MISLSRSAGTRGRVTPPRQDARAAGPPSWLVERLAARLDDLDGQVLRASAGPEWPPLVEAMGEMNR